MRVRSSGLLFPRLHRSGERELLAFCLLFFVSFLWWRAELFATYVKPDERPYIAAAKLTSEGQSPYLEPWYFYPPPFAIAGSWMLSALGERPYLLLLRVLTLSGACLTAWWSLLPTGWPVATRLTLALAVMLLSASVGVGLVQGNVSQLVIGLVIACLTLWQRRPMLAGLALALGLVTKPLAPLVPVVLAVHRPLDSTHRHRLAAAVAVAATAVMLIPGVLYLPELLDRVNGLAEHPRNLSLHRLFYCFRISPPPGVIPILVAAGAVLLVRTRRLDPKQLMAVATVATLLALPIVWIYTVLLALPVQFLALAMAWEQWRRRRATGPATGLPRIRSASAPLLAGVLLAAASPFFSHAAGAVESWPLWLQGVILAVPVLSPSCLLAYILYAGNPTAELSAV